LEQLDRRELLDPLDPLVHLELQGRVEPPVPQDQLEHLEVLVLLECRDQEVLQVQ